MVKKVLIFSVLFVMALCLVSCGDYEYEFLNENDVEKIFLQVGEEYELDIEEQFKKLEINISKYEISNEYYQDIISIDAINITGKKAGFATIFAKLYERKTDTIYSVRVAEVVVYDTSEMTEIKTVEDLKNIQKTGKYILKSNLDLKDQGNWEPLCNNSYDGHFQGMFINPDGYKISNLSIINTKGYSHIPYSGLFSAIRNAYIDGIILENVYIDVSDYDGLYQASAGGIAFYTYNSFIRNCVVDGVIIGQSTAGGITSHNYRSYILNSTFEGIVKTTKFSSIDDCVGGIVGFNETLNTFGGIENCTVEADVIGHNVAGGIVGKNVNNHLPINSTFKGSIKGDVIQGELAV